MLHNAMQKIMDLFALIPVNERLVWIYLLVACVCEIFLTLSLKISYGFTNISGTVATIVFGVLSTTFLSISIRIIPLGTAYAIWTSVGTIGSVLLGVFLFKESLDAIKVGCIFLIVTGVIGLKISHHY